MKLSILFMATPFRILLLGTRYSPLTLARPSVSNCLPPNQCLFSEAAQTIANAKVSVKSEATGEALLQVTTDASGLFTVTLLPVGDYTVEVNAAGFPDTLFSGVVVRITETTRMTAVVKTSVVKEIVEVQSEAEQVNTTDATTGESLVAQTITDLPLATRNFQQLLTLSPVRERRRHHDRGRLSLSG